MPADDRVHFDIPDDLIYLNTARMGARLHAVTRAGHEAVDRFAAPWAIRDQDWFDEPERLRSAIARLAGTETDSIAIIPSVSYGIAVAAKNLRLSGNDTIVVVEEQYPSNIYAWHRAAIETGAEIRVAKKSTEIPLTDALLALIDKSTAVIATPHCHWTDGELIDLERIAEAARGNDAALVIDASQSLGAVPIDLESLDPDFLVSVGYKWLLGPYSMSYLYVAERHRATGIPLEESWLNRRGSEDFAGLVDYVDEYRDGARRFDVGQFPNFVTIPMALAAIEQINRWTVSYIHHALSGLTETIRDTCQRLGIATLPGDRNAGHMIGIPMPDHASAERAVNTLREAHFLVSQRGRSIRVAPHLHTTDEEIARFCELLEQSV